MRKVFKFFVGMAFVAIAASSLGQIVNLADNNSTAKINAGTDDSVLKGLYDWHITPNGPNWVKQQLYLVRVNGGQVNSFNNLATPSVTGGAGSPLATISYALPGGVDFSFRYLLTGGQPNSADLAEVTTLVNRTGQTLSFSLFEYDEFTPGGIAGGTGTLLNSSTIEQTNSAGSVTIGTVPIPSKWMIGHALDVQNAILGGNLTNTTSPFSAEDLAFAFQWDVTVAPNQSWQMSKDKLIRAVPEPASLIALGGLALLAVRRRRKS